MSRQKKSEKPSDDEDEDEAKPAPWAVEIEFFTKPSFMSAILDIKIDDEHVSIVRDDKTILAFPREAVRKVLVMQTKKRKADIDID